MSLMVKEKEEARSQIVARRFGAKAEDYDAQAHLQRRAADRLAALLPEAQAPSVLEVGCGTGFLTRHLLDRYPGGRFRITDLAPEMVETCRQRYDGGAGHVDFAVMDGEAPDPGQRFDLIALNMTAQWFADPRASLDGLAGLLEPGGALLFSTLGPESFAEWRAALAEEGAPAGVVVMPSLPGVVESEKVVVCYDTASEFLSSMKAIGAGEPRVGYRPVPPGTLRRALRRLEREHEARVTWQLVFGEIRAVSQD